MKRFFSSLLPCLAAACSAIAADVRGEEFLMCAPGELLFADDFEPGTVSDRWGIRAFFEVEDGVLKRTDHEPDESARTFLKDAAFHNVVIRFDFMFDGASEIRLVTGSGGGYNTGIHIKPAYFDVTTAKRGEEYVPSWQGECSFDFKAGEWHVMTVEFSGDEVVAHVDEEHFVVGKHPIIDSERTYFAFQVNGSAAAFDNLSIWKSEPLAEWSARRAELIAAQEARPQAVDRDAMQQYDLIMLRLKDRLNRTDEAYRALVSRHEKLKTEIKADYPNAFHTHKELSKSIAKAKQEIRKSDPRFKEMENAVNKARRAEKECVHAVHAELENQPDHLYYAAFERRRSEMASDPALTKLARETARLEKELHRAFPEAFEDVDDLVEKRNAHVANLKNDADFVARRKAVAEAYNAITEYLYTAEPRLAQLAEARMAIINAKND